MGRSPCCDKMGLKKGPWTSDEDQKLIAYIQQHGHGNWHALPSKAGLRRCGKSCRLRWANYLRPDIKRGKFSLQEDDTIIQLHSLLGNRWSAIAAHLPKRTDNEIKNYWNTHLKKRLTTMGMDPVTHRPKNQTLGCGQSKDRANISHMAQWENARLEAEARSKFDSFNPNNLLTTAASSSGAPTPPPAPTTTQSPCPEVLNAWEWTHPIKDISAPIPGLQSIANANHVEMYYGACTGGLAINYGHDGHIKGTMGNSLDIHGVINSNHHSSQLYFANLGFPSYIGDYDTDNAPSTVSSNELYDIDGVVSCWGVLEETTL